MDIINSSVVQPLFINPAKIVVENTKNRAFIADSPSGIIFEVNLSNGDQSIFSDESVKRPRGMKLDSDNNRLLVVGVSSLHQSLVSIDLDTRRLTTLVDDNIPGVGLDDFPVSSIAFDKERNRVLFGGRKEIRAVNLATGDFVVFSNNETPNVLNTFKGRINAMAISVSSNRVYAVDSQRNIWSVDLTTGERELFTIYARATPTSILIDDINNQLLVADQKQVYAINLTDLEEKVISENTPPLSSPNNGISGLALDKNNRLLAIDDKINALLTIDRNTGERSVLSDNSYPNADNPFYRLSNIEVDSKNNRLIVSGETAVDISTGKRTRLPSFTNLPATFNGNTLKRGNVLDSDNNRLYGMDREFRIISIDLKTGEIIIISEAPEQGSLHFFSIYSLDKAKNRLLGVNGTRNIIAVDLASGQRSILSTNTFPNEHTPFGQIKDLVIDSINNRLLVLDVESIIAVDLNTGERTLIFEDKYQLVLPTSLAFDSVHNQVLVTDTIAGSGSVFAINITTGIATILVDKKTPNDKYPLSEPVDIVVDSKNNQAFVLDLDWGGIVAIDLTTGERKPLSTGLRVAE